MVDLTSEKAAAFLLLCNRPKNLAAVTNFIESKTSVVLTFVGMNSVYQYTHEEAAFLLAHYRMTTS